MARTLKRRGCRFIPLSLREANRFIEEYHRHNGSVQGYKFAIGLLFNGELVGVAIAGRPVARHLDDGETIEITRVCVKPGYKNASSMLYGRMIRICRLMGYRRVITYTVEGESRSSLKAVGFKPMTVVARQSWNRPNRSRREQPVYQRRKIRWEMKIDEHL